MPKIEDRDRSVEMFKGAKIVDAQVGTFTFTVAGLTVKDILFTIYSANIK